MVTSDFKYFFQNARLGLLYFSQKLFEQFRGPIQPKFFNSSLKLKLGGEKHNFQLVTELLKISSLKVSLQLCSELCTACPPGPICSLLANQVLREKKKTLRMVFSWVFCPERKIDTVFWRACKFVRHPVLPCENLVHLVLNVALSGCTGCIKPLRPCLCW